MFYIIASFVIGTCNKNACRFHPLPWFSGWLVLVYIKINLMDEVNNNNNDDDDFLCANILED